MAGRLRIARLVERTGVSFHAFSWGNCLKRHGAEARSGRCADRATGQVNHAAASANTCTGCEFDVTTLKNLPLLKSRIQWHQRVAANETLPPIRRAASRALVETMVPTARELEEADEKALQA